MLGRDGTREQTTYGSDDDVGSADTAGSDWCAHRDWSQYSARPRSGKRAARPRSRSSLHSAGRPRAPALSGILEALQLTIDEREHEGRQRETAQSERRRVRKLAVEDGERRLAL